MGAPMTPRKLACCPFCLLPGDSLTVSTMTPGGDRGARVLCLRCGANGPWCYGPKSQAIPAAIKRWNFWRKVR